MEKRGRTGGQPGTSTTTETQLDQMPDMLPEIQEEMFENDEVPAAGVNPPTMADPDPLETNTQRRGSRPRYPVDRYIPGTTELEQAHTFLFSLVKKAAKSAVELQDYSLVYAYLTDPEFGIVDAIIPHVQYQMQHIFKACKSDPDSPNYNKAVNGSHREAIMEAKDEEIRELEEHYTWTMMRCSALPEGANRLPEKWVFKIQRNIQAKMEDLEFIPTKKMELDGYVDSDFAGLSRFESDQDPVCVKSRTGYVITLGGCPVIWVSKLQTEIALSTLEAEYIALSSLMRDLVPMRRLLFEIGEKLKLDFVKLAMIHSTIFEENYGALGLAKAQNLTLRTKHISVKYHWLNDQIVKEKGFIIEKVESED
jgi:hypothetical protein